MAGPQASADACNTVSVMRRCYLHRTLARDPARQPLRPRDHRVRRLDRKGGRIGEDQSHEIVRGIRPKPASQPDLSCLPDLWSVGGGDERGPKPLPTPLHHRMLRGWRAHQGVGYAPAAAAAPIVVTGLELPRVLGRAETARFALGPALRTVLVHQPEPPTPKV